MDLDKHLFTLIRNGEFRASISTIKRGVKVKLTIGDYLQGREISVFYVL